MEENAHTVRELADTIDAQQNNRAQDRFRAELVKWLPVEHGMSMLARYDGMIQHGSFPETCKDI